MHGEVSRSAAQDRRNAELVDVSLSLSGAAMAAFLISLAITFVVSLAVALLLWISLMNVLTDLTGTRDRARFWTIFSAVLLVLVPLASSLFAYPEHEQPDLFLGVIRQLRWSLVGLIATLVLIGVVIIAFVRSLSIEERRPELRRRREVSE